MFKSAKLYREPFNFAFIETTSKRIVLILNTDANQLTACSLEALQSLEQLLPFARDAGALLRELRTNTCAVGAVDPEAAGQRLEHVAPHAAHELTVDRHRDVVRNALVRN
jgi:hypothetical protein